MHNQLPLTKLERLMRQGDVAGRIIEARQKLRISKCPLEQMALNATLEADTFLYLVYHKDIAHRNNWLASWNLSGDERKAAGL